MKKDYPDGSSPSGGENVVECCTKTRLLSVLTSFFVFLCAFSALLLEGTGVLESSKRSWATTLRWGGFCAAEWLIGGPIVVAVLLLVVILSCSAREMRGKEGRLER